MEQDGKENERKQKNGQKILGKIFAFFLAFLSGMVNVLFGGGGGMLVVPALAECMGVERKRAHASAIAVILPLTIISAIIFTLRGTIDAALAVKVGAGAVLGGVLGAILLKKAPKEMLSILFYGVMIYAGVKFVS